MIECRDVLDLCDRFDKFLIPLDIHVLRQRYNGQTFKSTYAVARDMGLSDETVRTIENRALAALAHCLDLEANEQDITPMRLAKSIKQPVASLICRGLWRSAFCAAYSAHRGEVLIFSPAKPMPIDEFAMHVRQQYIEHMTAYPCGVIVGRVLLIDCFRLPVPVPHAHQWIMRFEQPEIFPEPMPYSGEPSFFYINTAVAQQLPPRYAYAYQSSQSLT
jgi:hypothetical protein